MGEVGLLKGDLQQSTGYVNTTVVEACIPKMKIASPSNGLRERCSQHNELQGDHQWIVAHMT